MIFFWDFSGNCLGAIIVIALVIVLSVFSLFLIVFKYLLIGLGAIFAVCAIVGFTRILWRKYKNMVL